MELSLRAPLLIALTAVALAGSGQPLKLAGRHVPAPTTATLTGVMNGKQVGTATYSVTPKADGTFVKSFSIKIELQGNIVESKSDIHVSPAGQSLDKELSILVGGQMKSHFTTAFGPKQATVIDKLTGKKTNFPYPASPSSRDTSELWFLSVHPKVGDKVIASSFAAGKGWQTTTITYESDKPFKLGDKTMTGHLIKHADAGAPYERLVDDSGFPLEFDLPGIPGLEFTRTQG